MLLIVYVNKLAKNAILKNLNFILWYLHPNSMKKHFYTSRFPPIKLPPHMPTKVQKTELLMNLLHTSFVLVQLKTQQQWLLNFPHPDSRKSHILCQAELIHNL